MKTRVTQKNLLTRFKRKPVEPLPSVLAPSKGLEQKHAIKHNSESERKP